jgi:hypothetical protein
VIRAQRQQRSIGDSYHGARSAQKGRVKFHRRCFQRRLVEQRGTSLRGAECARPGRSKLRQSWCDRIFLGWAVPPRWLCQGRVHSEVGVGPRR